MHTVHSSRRLKASKKFGRLLGWSGLTWLLTVLVGLASPVVTFAGPPQPPIAYPATFR